MTEGSSGSSSASHLQVSGLKFNTFCGLTASTSVHLEHGTGVMISSFHSPRNGAVSKRFAHKQMSLSHKGELQPVSEAQ